MVPKDSLELEKVWAEARDIASKAQEALSSAHLLFALFTLPNSAELFLQEHKIDLRKILDYTRKIRQESAQMIHNIKTKSIQMSSARGVFSDVNCLHLLVSLCSITNSAAYAMLVGANIQIAELRKSANSLLSRGNLPSRYRERFSDYLLGLIDPQDENDEEYYDREHTCAFSEPKEKIRTEIPSETLRVVDKKTTFSAPLTKNYLREDGSKKRAKSANTSPIVGYHLNEDEFPLLNSLGRNLSQQAAENRIDSLIGREKELEELLVILGQRRTNNPLLLGEAGVGKTALVEGLALELVKKPDKYKNLGDKILVEVDIGSILAGTQYRGTFSEKMKGLKDEVKRAAGKVIVFIDEIHCLIGAGSSNENTQDAANELKTSLARGEFPCIGATTFKEYRKHLSKDDALIRRFQLVKLDEPDEDKAVEILKGVAPHYQKHHHVIFSDECIVMAVKLAIKYITDRHMPDKAIALLDHAGSKAAQEGKETVEVDDIYKVVSTLTGIPMDRMGCQNSDYILLVEEEIGKNIVGHEEVIVKACQTIRRNYAGFSSNRPMGSFLFLGPTGVGKTEMAKSIADYFFGSQKRMLILDMSEYNQPHSISRLIGSPPGYIGFDEGGLLTGRVKKDPFQLILFDEVEKACIEVVRLLLQILDEGRLTDNLNRQVDFSNTVVILTTNMGSEYFYSGPSGRRTIGFSKGEEDKDQQRNAILSLTRKRFSPELWSRIDEKMIFFPLNHEEILKVTRLLIDKSAGVLYNQRGISYHYRPAVLDYLVEHGGFNIDTGARPMRRIIENLVENPLSEYIIRGEIKGGDQVMVDVIDNQLHFKRSNPLHPVGECPS